MGVWKVNVHSHRLAALDLLCGVFSFPEVLDCNVEQLFSFSQLAGASCALLGEFPSDSFGPREGYCHTAVRKWNM